MQSELARPGIAPYTASKGAVKMLTKGMAVDWGRHGLNVNGIGPGYFDTELNAALVGDEKFSSWLVDRTPSGRWGRIDELGGAAIFLASDASSFVNGHVLYVDGGDHGIALAHVEAMAMHRQAFGAQGRRSGLQPGGVAAVDDQRRAGPSERSRDTVADTGAGTGHQRKLAGEIELPQGRCAGVGYRRLAHSGLTPAACATRA